MLRIKQMRRKLGLLYWKCHAKVKTWWYFRKKNWRRFADWIRGWFYASKISMTEPMQVKHLLVCAHPDDETIFFSTILKKERPFVVCVSNRGHKVRKEEFKKALGFWGVEGTMLNFPDVPGLTFVWRWRMAATLKRIRKKLPAVMTVYTHSACGESGHPHHYAVNAGVRKVFENCRIITTAVTIPANGEGRLTEDEVEEKYSVIKRCYPSQINMLEKWCPWWQDYLTIEFFEE